MLEILILQPTSMCCPKEHTIMMTMIVSMRGEHPELGFTDAQVEAEVEKLNPEDKKFYEDYHEFLDVYY